MRLPFARLDRDQLGGRFIVVQYPRDGLLRLPVDWTDRGTPCIPPRAEGRELRVTVQLLLTLARACCAARLNGLDKSDGGRTLEPRIQDMAAPTDGPSSAAVVESIQPAEADTDRRLGDVGAQTVAEQSRGGDRS